MGLSLDQDTYDAVWLALDADDRVTTNGAGRAALVAEIAVRLATGTTKDGDLEHAVAKLRELSGEDS